MYHYTATFNNEIKVGDEVFITDKELSIENIVSAVKTSESEWDLLIVLTDEGASSNSFVVRSGTLNEIIKIDLPYVIEESSE